MSDERSQSDEVSAAGPRFKPLVILAGVFVLGSVAGGAIARTYTLKEQKQWYGATAEERVQIRADAMKRQLDLSDQQAQAVATIFRESEGEREKVMEPCRPGLDQLRERNNARIRDVLSASQQKKFEDLTKRASRSIGYLPSTKLLEVPALEVPSVPSKLPELPTGLPLPDPNSFKGFPSSIPTAIPTAIPEMPLPQIPSTLPLPELPSALPIEVPKLPGDSPRGEKPRDIDEPRRDRRDRGRGERYRDR